MYQKQKLFDSKKRKLVEVVAKVIPDVNHAISRKRILACFVGDHLNANHQAFTADVAYNLETLAKFLQTPHQIIA